MGKMERNEKLQVNIQAKCNPSVASNLFAYLSCASLDDPLPPAGIFLQPWARNEKNNARSEISQVIHALAAEKDDANRCVIGGYLITWGDMQQRNRKHAGGTRVDTRGSN